MRVTHLSLTNFRNYMRLERSLPGGVVILVGRNAQGKTGLLEAIYYLATAGSPHQITDRQLINWFAQRKDPLTFMKLVAEVQTKTNLHRLDIRLELEPTGGGRDPRLKKTVLIDGIKKRVADLGRAINVVLFLPQDLALVEGSPADRRRYLDATLCQIDPLYYEALSEYGKVLSQRNALLKQMQENRTLRVDLLAVWEQPLAGYGAAIIVRRAQAIEELEQSATRYHSTMSGGAEYLRLMYRPSYDPTPLDAASEAQLNLGLEVPVTRRHVPEAEIMSGLLAALQRNRADDIDRGQTTLGPHRDDFRFVASGVDLSVYGSRGQARTAVLATKLAEMHWMHQRTGEWPVLLLDEVLAELDPQRRGFLLAQLAQVEQALLTTTDLDMFAPEFCATSEVWQIENGTIRTTNT